MNTVYIFEGCRFDVEARVVYARDGKPHPLKAKTHETLLYLVENPGRVIQRDEIMSAVWPDTVVEENNLTQHIASLRRLFGDTPTDHRFIETIAGRGYQFNAAVTRSDDGDRKSSDPPTRLARKRLIALAAGVVISLLLLLGVFYPREISGTDGPIKSIAVLPCKPIGEHDRNPSLQAGITHELISKLKSADGLSVSPY